MAGSKSAYLEAALLNYILGASALSAPTNVYVALSTAPFSATATGSAMTEVSGGSYARQSLTNNSTNWPNATGSNPAVKSNGTAITFPTATAGWGTVQSVYLVDASSGGNILYGADLAASVVVSTGAGFSIPIGQLVITET